MRRKNVKKATLAAVDLLTGLLEKLTDKTSSLATNLWEAIGDLRKNVGDVRLDANRLGAEVTTLKADRDRAWALNESRNAVHRKNAEDLMGALQRMNERLSKLEGNRTQGQVDMLAECLAAQNARQERLAEGARDILDRLNKLEEIRGVMPLFKSSTEAGMIRALPGILRMIHSPSFVKAVEEAGYKIDVEAIISLVQKIVDERDAAQQEAKPARAVVWQQGHITTPGAKKPEHGLV